MQQWRVGLRLVWVLAGEAINFLVCKEPPFILVPTALSMTQSTPVANESGAMTQPGGHQRWSRTIRFVDRWHGHS